MTPANIAGPTSQFTRSLRGVQALIAAMTGAAEERTRRREYMARETERELARGERRERFEWEKTRAAKAFEAAEEERKFRMDIRAREYFEQTGEWPRGYTPPAAEAVPGAPRKSLPQLRKEIVDESARAAGLTKRAEDGTDLEVAQAEREGRRRAMAETKGMNRFDLAEYRRTLPALLAPRERVKEEEPIAIWEALPGEPGGRPAAVRRELGREWEAGRELVGRREPPTFAELRGLPLLGRVGAGVGAARELAGLLAPRGRPAARAAGRAALAPGRALGEVLARGIGGTETLPIWVEEAAGIEPSRRGLAPTALAGEELGVLGRQRRGQLSPAVIEALEARAGQRGAGSRARLPQPGEDPEVFASRMANLGVPSPEIDAAMEAYFPFPTHTRPR